MGTIKAIGNYPMPALQLFSGLELKQNLLISGGDINSLKGIIKWITDSRTQGRILAYPSQIGSALVKLYQA
jgi:hypothetical protein